MLNRILSLIMLLLLSPIFMMVVALLIFFEDGFPVFFKQNRVGDNYILDFYCDALLLAIEIDGYSHQFLEVFNKDTKKEKRMNELGITVLRFSDEQVLKDMENVIRALEDYIYEFEKHTPNPSLRPVLSAVEIGS
ncbi:MAG: DUF559 domain-containing protein [Lutibacter sp.]